MSQQVAIQVLSALSSYGIPIDDQELWGEMLRKVENILESHSYEIISNDPDTVAVIRWHREDIASMLQQNGIEPTESHIDAVKKRSDWIKDSSVQTGWEIIDDIIGILKSEGAFSSTPPGDLAENQEENEEEGVESNG